MKHLVYKITVEEFEGKKMVDFYISSSNLSLMLDGEFFNNPFFDAKTNESHTFKGIILNKLSENER